MRLEVEGQYEIEAGIAEHVWNSPGNRGTDLLT